MPKLLTFNKACTRCALGNGCAVPGQSEVAFDQVSLIVISAYPGAREIQTGLSLAPKDPTKKQGSIGAGEFLRLSLRACFDVDPDISDQLKPFENFCYMTNALHCSPQRGKDKITISQRMIQTCHNEWLTRELRLIHPKVPILLAGSEAVKSILGKDSSLYSSRRQVFRYEEHPVVVTFNPIEAERGMMMQLTNPNAEQDLLKLFSKVKNVGKKTAQLVQARYWKPILPGMIAWHWKRDLELIKSEVIRFRAEYPL